MSTDALDIYAEQLQEQLGENGNGTESGLLSPDGVKVVKIWGWFEHNTFRSGRDTAKQVPKREGARFITAGKQELGDFDVYNNIEIYFPYRDETYIIQYAEKDDNGAQVLWLV